MKLAKFNPKRFFIRSKDPSALSFGSASSSSFSGPDCKNPSVVNGGDSVTPTSILPEVSGDPSPSSYVEILQAFKLIDRDNDGAVSRHDLESLLSRLGPDPLTEEEINVMIKEKIILTFKLKDSGDLAEANFKLNQELANHGSEANELQTKLSALEAEKEQTSNELQASKTIIEVLTKQLTSEGEKLKLQISSHVEENNQVNAMFQSTKDELQSVIAKLEERLTLESSEADTLVSEIEKLKAVAAEKFVLESHIEELEKTLTEDKAHLKEEVENAAAASVKVAKLTSKLQEHEYITGERDVLNEQVLQLQKELQAA